MNRVRSACGGSTLEACKSALALAIKGEEWRLRPLTAYKQRLRSLLDIWRRCRKAKPVFRAIFKLAPAPRAMQGTAGCMSASGARHLRIILKQPTASPNRWLRTLASRHSVILLPRCMRRRHGSTNNSLVARVIRITGSLDRRPFLMWRHKRLSIRYAASPLKGQW